MLRFQVLNIACRRPAGISCHHRQMAEQAADLDVRADSYCEEMVLYCIMQ
ncbi:MAG: hypothetical protein GWP16_05185 [Nitrospirae bacterium]|nr:hypothetical protein [Nitrospirota bacterium]